MTEKLVQPISSRFCRNRFHAGAGMGIWASSQAQGKSGQDRSWRTMCRFESGPHSSTKFDPENKATTGVLKQDAKWTQNVSTLSHIGQILTSPAYSINETGR